MDSSEFYGPKINPFKMAIIRTSRARMEQEKDILEKFIKLIYNEFNDISKEFIADLRSSVLPNGDVDPELNELVLIYFRKIHRLMRRLITRKAESGNDLNYSSDLEDAYKQLDAAIVRSLRRRPAFFFGKKHIIPKRRRIVINKFGEVTLYSPPLVVPPPDPILDDDFQFQLELKAKARLWLQTFTFKCEDYINDTLWKIWTHTRSSPDVLFDIAKELNNLTMVIIRDLYYNTV